MKEMDQNTHRSVWVNGGQMFLELSHSPAFIAVNYLVFYPLIGSFHNKSHRTQFLHTISVK